MMSDFECCLNRRSWRKKMVQVVQIGGKGGVEVIWTKSKRTATFFVKPSLTLPDDNTNTYVLRII